MKPTNHLTVTRRLTKLSPQTKKGRQRRVKTSLCTWTVSAALEQLSSRMHLHPSLKRSLPSLMNKARYLWWKIIWSDPTWSLRESDLRFFWISPPRMSTFGRKPLLCLGNWWTWTLLEKSWLTTTPTVKSNLFYNNLMIFLCQLKCGVSIFWLFLAPMYNPRAKKVQFQTRFQTLTSLLEMERDSSFMAWLKENKIYTLVMTLHSTENVWVGFFLGKCPHITNIPVFSQWIRSRSTLHTNECPDFQLNVEIIGRHKDPTTRTWALVPICPQMKFVNLRRFGNGVSPSLKLSLFSISGDVYLGCSHSKRTVQGP